MSGFLFCSECRYKGLTCTGGGVAGTSWRHALWYMWVFRIPGLTLGRSWSGRGGGAVTRSANVGISVLFSDRDRRLTCQARFVCLSFPRGAAVHPP